MDHEGAGNDIDGQIGHPHFAAALETKIDLGRIGMRVVRTDLARFPTGDGDVSFAEFPENVFNVLFRIELLFRLEVECPHCLLHSVHRPQAAWRGALCKGSNRGDAGRADRDQRVRWSAIAGLAWRWVNESRGKRRR